MAGRFIHGTDDTRRTPQACHAGITGIVQFTLRGTPMFLQTSLRAQILALLGGSLALILVTALACFSFLSNGMQAYQGLLAGPLEKSTRIDAANLN